MFNTNSKFIGDSSNFGSYGGFGGRTSSDFEQAKEEIREFVLNNLEGDYGPDISLYEYDIQEQFRTQYKKSRSLGIGFFVKTLLDTLINQGVQFGYWREGKRSRFFGIKLKDSGRSSSETVGSQPPHGSSPHEEPKEEYGNERKSQDNFDGFLDDDDDDEDEIRSSSDSKTSLSKAEVIYPTEDSSNVFLLDEPFDDDASTSDDDEDISNWVEDYIQLEPSQEMSVHNMKKLFTVVAKGDEGAFNAFLDKFIAGNRELSIRKEPGKNGKQKRYIHGLALSDKGKQALKK
jgi:hypothetical protein